MNLQMCFDVKRMFFYMCMLLFSSSVFGQTAASRLQEAFRQFEKDEQLKHALISLYVIDAKTGKVVFDKNSQTGLAPASTQKIITSVTAFELLGKDYRFRTAFGIAEERGVKALYIRPSGDPTLGSWRWENTKESNVIKRIITAMGASKAQVSYALLDSTGWTDQYTPDGWIWQDIGNYYGAGALGLNWRENQYDLVLQSDETVGSPVRIIKTIPNLYSGQPTSLLKAGPKGSGDNAYIYPYSGRVSEVRGTIPAGEKSFVISGAFSDPAVEFTGNLMDSIQAGTGKKLEGGLYKTGAAGKVSIFHTEISPPLDSIIYWFNKKSINLYGEALLKAIAFEKNKRGYARDGVKIIRSFWKERGLDEEELNIVDGSGLSPLDRVTTHAQVTILQYAKNKPWYPAFYDALPEYNGMKMKSGTISGVKGFCGYQVSKDGVEYVFSFLVNNYSGGASSVVSKMYGVLDCLK